MKGKLNCDIEKCEALCCRNCAVLTEEEVEELIVNARREYSRDLDPKKYFKQAKGEYSTYYAIKMIKGQCIFLDKEKRCRIYRCRPKLCELYPVIDVDTVDIQCPNVRDGKLSADLLTSLKQRYSFEVDERIKKEQTFRFV